MPDLHVAFVIGDATYVVPASVVLHLDSFERATPVPGAPAFVAGLVQVRGRLVPVIDLRTRFGLPAIAHSIDRRVIVVQLGGRVTGLLVDSARDVIAIDPAAFAPPPSILDHGDDGFVKAVATIAKRLYLLIDVARVIREDQSHG